jgi:tripartite motif-containing protein 71
MRFLIAISLIAGLVFVPSASASSCPGANSCPWTQVDTFGDVGTDEFRAPTGAGADASGNVYVVENDMHRVQKLDPSGAVLASWGGMGSGAGELWYPYDIAVDAASGGVYVTDNSNQRVSKFDTSGKFVSAWGWGVSDGSPAYQVCTTGCRKGIAGSGTGQFSSAIGIATDGVNVYVADWTNKRIQKYDLAGAPAGQWTIPGGQTPERVAVAGGSIYVTTTADRVWRFDTNGVPDGSWDGDGETGSSGTGPGQLKRPKGIAVDGTGVYVAEEGNDRISKFDLTGAFKASWGTGGAADGQFYAPQGLLATGGSVWVADAYNHRIQKFDQSGVHQATVGAPLGVGDFYFPRDIATAPSGDVYVSTAHTIDRLDGSGTPTARWDLAPALAYSVTPTENGVYAAVAGDRLRRYDSAGQLLNQFGGTGSAVGELSYPGGTAADAEGNVYVADRGNHRVQKFSPMGAPLAVFGGPGSGDGKLNTPRDVALDSAGNVYVTDSGYNRIQKFSPAGDFQAKWGSIGSADGQFRNPYGIAVDADGHVFVADDLNHRIQEFDSNGQFLAKWGTFGTDRGELARPEGISVDSAGALWVADSDNHRIVRFCCPAAHGGGSEGSDAPSARPAGATEEPDTTAPTIKLGGLAAQRSGLVRRRGLGLRLATSERAAVTLRAVVSARSAHMLGLSSRTVGRATADLAGPGTQALRLRLSAHARRTLSRLGRVRLVVRARAADPAGNRSSASLRVLVKR